MYQSSMQKQVSDLLEQGKLGDSLVALMHKGKYKLITQAFKGYQDNIRHINILDKEPEKELTALREAFDIFEDVIARLPEEQHSVFFALVFKGMGVDHAVYTYNSSEFKDEFVQSANDFIQRAEKGGQTDRAIARKNKYDSEYKALSNHPFVAKMRETVRYPDRKTALETVRALWENGDKDGFLYVFDTLSQTQNRQQYKVDPDFFEDSFADQMTTYEGLELVVMNVRRGNKWGGGGITDANLPPLRILVSNKEKPLDLNPNDQPKPENGEQDGWKAESVDPDFWILTANGKFTDLESYMRASLSYRAESSGHGPYSFSSSDDRTYGTAANVMAKIQEFLRVPRNFEAPAQDRLRDQVENIEMSAFAPIYMNRFMRMQGSSKWTMALNLVQSHREDRPIMEELIGYEEAAEILITHGLADAVDHIDNGAVHDDIEKARAAFTGYVSGMNKLYDDMIELSRIGEDINAGDALDRFERTRGFHPDVLNFPVSERKRLAYQDLSDIAVAHLTGHMMMDICTEEQEPRKEKSSISEIWDLRDEMLRDVPLSGIMDVMIEANDVTNFMRLLDHFDAFGHRIGGARVKIKQAEILKRKIAKAGYALSDERLTMSRFNKLPFRAVFDTDANLSLKTKHMVRFKTVEQIIHDDNLPEALWAREVITVYKFPEQAQERQEEQAQSLTDFIEQKIVAKELRKQLSDVAEEDRDLHIAFMRELLPNMLGIIAYEENLSTDELAREVKVAAGAFDEATGKKPKARFARVMTALSGVSGLWNKRQP